MNKPMSNRKLGSSLNSKFSLDTLWGQLQGKLDELNPRERKLVSYGGALSALVIVWFVLVDPAVATLTGSEQRIQALVQKAGAVERAAQNLEALRGARSRVQVQSSELDTRLKRILTDEGITDGATVDRTEEGMIRVNLQQVPAGALLKWLAQAETLSGLKTSELKLQKTDAGVVSGEVVFGTQASGLNAGVGGQK
jgi:general secretion pathway protein M